MKLAISVLVVIVLLVAFLKVSETRAELSSGNEASGEVLSEADIINSEDDTIISEDEFSEENGGEYRESRGIFKKKVTPTDLLLHIFKNTSSQKIEFYNCIKIIIL